MISSSFLSTPLFFLLSSFFISTFIPYLTSRLALNKYMNKIRASSLLTFIFVFSMHRLNFNHDLRLDALFLGSTFIGMSDSNIFKFKDYFFVGIIFFILFHLLYVSIVGPGGIIGFLVLTSIILFTGIKNIINYEKIK